MAIHRAGVRLDANRGQIPLRAGDALVLHTDAEFRRRWQTRADFLVISALDDEVEPVAPGRWRTPAVLLSMFRPITSWF